VASLALLLVLFAAPPRPVVVAVDAATGRVLGGVRSDRVDADGRTLLCVYRRGYDLARIALGEPTGPVTVPLTRAADACTLEVEGAGCGLLVRVSVTVPGAGRRGPLRDYYECASDGSRIRLALSRGTVAGLLVLPHRGVAWPIAFRAKPGAVHSLRYEPPRELPVLASGELAQESLEFLPDRLWVPDAEPDRVDAWRWHLNRARWIELCGETLSISPDVPFHCFTAVEGRPVYRYVTREAPALDLRDPDSPATVAARPWVDGAPAPEGSLLAPGRLDACAVAALWQLRRSLPGCCLRLGPGSARWPRPMLPAAAWLTLWHPDLGLAHLRWERERRPAGRTRPGVLLVLPPPGWGVSGRVAVYPVWKGAGRVRTVPPVGLLGKRFEGGRRLRFPGLPPGRYGLEIDVELEDPSTGRTVAVEGAGEIDLPRSRPSAVYRLGP
jgi:hypothetical protein